MKVLKTTDTHAGFNAKTHNIHYKFVKKCAQSIKKNDIKIFFHAGDWISTRQCEFDKTLEMFANSISIPIITVRGNHDFWDEDDQFNSLSRMNEFHKQLFQKYNIIHLDGAAYRYEDIIICGFDGWYGVDNPPTKDDMFLNKFDCGTRAMVHLSNKAYKDFDKVLSMETSNYRKSLCITHFPMFTEDDEYIDYCANFNYLPHLIDKFDISFVGHSHQKSNPLIISNGSKSCPTYNAGSHYNNPKYIIIDI